MNHIRNFAIIAHIDHGKSTLADRLLELTGVVSKDKHEEQLLDRNPISRERGITIKLAPVRMSYELDGERFQLNLIDTPGHVDFSYEVDRTLSCVEGAVLLIDATQGIQAQTISNAYKALEKNLTIIPVINKIDLPHADVPKAKKQIVDFLGIAEAEIHEISAKTGLGVQELLNDIIKKVPGPNFNENNTELQSLIFDSYYDSHKGVIAFVRIFDGQVKKRDKVRLIADKSVFEVSEVGVFGPELTQVESLQKGEIGYVVTNLKDIHQVRVGDSMTAEKSKNPALSGYKKVKSMVFASMFPTDASEYLNLKKALDKLYLNDSSLEFTPIFSQALGAGFRVGFLGLLHADVVRERLEREYELDLVLTPPQVEYQFENNTYLEPYVRIFMVMPPEYQGPVMTICQEYRGRFITMDNKNQITLTYEMPLAEMISDFFDRLKSVSSGYASLDWELVRYEPVKADKLSLLINGDPIEEFSEIVVQERAQEKAQDLTKRLREVIHRQQFEIKIQGQYKGKIIASERIAPFRKDVLMKGSKAVGGGDVGRKRKVLERQKEGKKRMKMIGSVEVPKEAFLKIFNKK